MTERTSTGVEKLAFLQPQKSFAELYAHEAKELFDEAFFETKNVLFESSEWKVILHAKYKIKKNWGAIHSTLVGLTLAATSGKTVDLLELLPGKAIAIKHDSHHAEHNPDTGEITTTPIDTMVDLLTLLHEEGHEQHRLEHPEEVADFSTEGRNNFRMRGALRYVIRHENNSLPQTHTVPRILKELYSEMQKIEKYSQLPFDLMYLLKAWKATEWELRIMCIEREATLNSLKLLTKVEEALDMNFSGVFRTGVVQKFDESLDGFGPKQIRAREILANIYVVYKEDHLKTTGGLWESFNQMQKKINDTIKTEDPYLWEKLQKYKANGTVST